MLDIKTREMDTMLSVTNHKCGIGTLLIFDTVFRYLPILLTVLRYWVPPMSPSLTSGSRIHMAWYQTVSSVLHTQIIFATVNGLSKNVGFRNNCLRGEGKEYSINILPGWCDMGVLYHNRKMANTSISHPPTLATHYSPKILLLFYCV